MRTFDGLICFGGADWWYHNRGHYDIQMAQRFRDHGPVLYVNSIGVRLPSLGEGGMFFRRAGRKLRSWSRGFRRVDDRFGVVSPISIPGRVGRAASGHVLPRQVRWSAARMGITRPLVWIECPTAAPLLDDIEHVGLVYQRTDRYETFPGVDRPYIETCDQRLKEDADVTLFCSTYLYESEREACRTARFVDHGVDYDRFAERGVTPREPEDVRDLPRPRVGFVGGIDSHTFDPELFVAVAEACPEATFVLVGGCSLPAGWCTAPNVIMLGRKPYEDVADYMAACDVLIMPWNRNEWIKACNPVKLKEYLAVGRPVVSTPFEELRRYETHVRVAEDAAGFAEAVREALETPGDPEPRRERVRRETWTAKADAVVAYLAEAGIEPASPTPAEPALAAAREPGH